ncbi:MAG: HupE/UreJ family protein [Neptuniibacter sp.]
MRRILIPSSIAAAMFVATPVLAHNETISLSSSFLSGLLHPLTGFDHLLAMIAFGIWFSLQNSKQSYSLPTTLLVMLIAGFGLGVTGLNLPMIEGGILSSLLVIGLLVATATKLKAQIALPLTGAFALFHGFAHGAEIGSSLAGLFMIGFVLSCAVTVMISSKASLKLQAKMPLVNKFIGLLIAMTGLSLVAG